MSAQYRPVNMEHPAYQEGVDLANRALDARHGPSTTDMIQGGETAALIAHNTEDVAAYHRSVGFTNTVREYIADRSDV